jgi:hypothetical protein
MECYLDLSIAVFANKVPEMRFSLASGAIGLVLVGQIEFELSSVCAGYAPNEQARCERSQSTIASHFSSPLFGRKALVWLEA